MAEEGIAETLSLTCTFDKTGNVGHVEEGRHLAEEVWKSMDHFEFFYRRESGNCRICWSADAKEDVGVTGKTNGKAVTKVSFG